MDIKMDVTLSLTSIVAMFVTMLALAAIPSASVLAVSARSVSSGLIHGILTAAGVVAGDIIFILLAIGGLAVLVEATGDLFVFVKYFACGYLIWLGVKLWRTQGKSRTVEGIRDASLFSSFLAGLLITLADQKAVFFYLGFFPAFFDLDAASALDIAIVIWVAVLTVGGTKIAYAIAASRAGLYFSPKLGVLLNKIAGSLMIGAAVLMLFLR
ncbi:MAG: LysE family translocator [Limnospira sp.]